MYQLIKTHYMLPGVYHLVVLSSHTFVFLAYTFTVVLSYEIVSVPTASWVQEL